MAHNDFIIDSDGHFIIDSITREITNQSDKTTLMQFDHNSERLTFEVNPIIEGHEMAKSNRVEIHYVNIASDKRSQVSGFYPVDDVTLKDNKLTFSWLVSRNVTQLAGVVSFVVRFICTDDDVEVYSWSTAKSDVLKVAESLNNSGAIDEDYSDLINQWYSMLVGSGTEGVNKVEEARNNALAELSEKKTKILNDIIDRVEKKGVETLESIPDDYTALNEKIDNIETECYDRLITNKAKGEIISLSDSANAPFKNIKIFGKTTQNGTPTLDAPIELVSVGDGGSTKAYIVGENLFGGTTFRDAIKSVIPSAIIDETNNTIQYRGDKSSNCIFANNIFKEKTQYTLIISGRNIQADSVFTNIRIRYTNNSSQSIYFDVANKNTKIAIVTDANKTVKDISGQFAGYTTSLYYNECGIFEGVVTLDNFKPYKEQSFTISTPNRLPGLPVSSGGNYIDRNGQQWIGDEFDLNNRSITKRIETVILTDTDLWKKSGVTLHNDYYSFYCNLGGNIRVDGLICDKLEYKYYETNWTNNAVGEFITIKPTTDGTKAVISVNILKSRIDSYTGDAVLDKFNKFIKDNPLTVQYAKTNFSTETVEIAEDEIPSFKTLRTHYPNTNIFNSESIGIEVEYKADTKIYIDNKFAQIEATILNLG